MPVNNCQPGVQGYIKLEKLTEFHEVHAAELSAIVTTRGCYRWESRKPAQKAHYYSVYGSFRDDVLDWYIDWYIFWRYSESLPNKLLNLPTSLYLAGDIV